MSSMGVETPSAWLEDSGDRKTDYDATHFGTLSHTMPSRRPSTQNDRPDGLVHVPSMWICLDRDNVYIALPVKHRVEIPEKDGGPRRQKVLSHVTIEQAVQATLGRCMDIKAAMANASNYEAQTEHSAVRVRKER